MKVIVVSDNDGHTNVFRYNIENMRECLKCLIKLGYINENISDNQSTEECAIICANQLLNTGTVEEIEEFIDEEYITGRGKPLNILEVMDDWKNYLDF